MTIKSKVLAIASAAMLSSSIAVAQASYTPTDFTDVSVFDSFKGSDVYTIDGQALGTVKDVDLDANTADFIIEVAQDANLQRDTINVKAEQGTVAINDGMIILLVDNDEIQQKLQGSERSDSIAEIDLFKE